MMCRPSLRAHERQVATESLGDMEVLDALIAREKFYTRVGDKQAALKAADDVRWSVGPWWWLGRPALFRMVPWMLTGIALL